MNKRDANLLRPDIYRLRWKDGGSSFAAVGQNINGDSWFAPTDWTHVPSYNWRQVKSVEDLRIESER